MKNIYNCCCLCLREDEHNGDDLVWYDGMQLCRTCYLWYAPEVRKSDREGMLVNAIRNYRRRIYEWQNKNDNYLK